ncbi:gamma-glutamyltransferase [Ancylobacter oerskovii]|uniref:Glutathione hydrolase proenzyme n=1 Tax=Ancylobacter oerskovii TaxID=459519 RepID=A0ABW4YWX9_9HYPH|nr:gamma-glutamyltransferase [Ancylobacter oerskovii]MBS7542152.1 gamma-glutamyltransferase [Ancylobacter oerskovii]
MVTSPHTLASEAGAKVLREGGNAIEAAVAIGAAIAVTYPHFCGIGGDAIWMIADSDGRRSTIMGIGQAPMKVPAYSGPIPVRGPASTASSACAVDAWRVALDFSATHWGGRRNLAELMDPAIGYAENGFAYSPSQAFWTDFRKNDLPAWPGFVETFLPGGTAPRTGDTFVQKQLAESLKLIARNGARDFYEGELAARLAKGLAQAGSPLTAEDLRATRALLEEPVALDYRGLTLLAPPPPTQGISTLAILGVLNRFDLAAVEEGSPEYYHLCVEAVKQAFLDRGRIADPHFVDLPADLWLDAALLDRKAAAIDRKRAMPWPAVFKTGDTVFFGATDAQGRSVSVLQSTYFDWGSGVVVGDTGVLWQNRGAAFSTDPKSPNAIAPGKRPFYTLNPGMALKGGKPHILYGTQGADGQPQTLTVVLTRLIDYGLDPSEALARPRFLLGRTFSDSRDTLKLERSISPATVAALERMGHQTSLIPANSALAGQAGAIVIGDDGTITGAHDPRSDGIAIGI